MKQVFSVLSIITLLLLTMQFTSAAFPTTCAEITAAGTYTLNAPLTPSVTTCANVTAPDVTINCAGYWFSPSTSAAQYAIYTNSTNTTIKNCLIKNFMGNDSSAAIYATSTATNLNISNVTFYNDSKGIQSLANATNITSNNFTQLNNTAINVTTYARVYNNIIYNISVPAGEWYVATIGANTNFSNNNIDLTSGTTTVPLISDGNDTAIQYNIINWTNAASGSHALDMGILVTSYRQLLDGNTIYCRYSLCLGLNGYYSSMVNNVIYSDLDTNTPASIFYGSYWNVTNNTFYSQEGIEVQTNNSNYSRNTFIKRYSNGTVFTGPTIGIWFGGVATSNTYVNITVHDSNLSDLGYSVRFKNANVTMINTSFNTSDVSLGPAFDAGYLTVKMPLNVTTVNSTFKNLGTVTLTMQNTSTLQSTTSDASGYSLTNITVAYFANSPFATNYTSLTINGTKASYIDNQTTTLMTYGTAGAYQSVILVMPSDGTSPAVSFIAPVNNSNLTGTYSVNVSATDVSSSIDTVKLNITNSSGSQALVTTTNSGGAYYNYSYNFSTLATGLYYVTIVANDTAGNINNTESITVNVDNTLPQITNVVNKTVTTTTFTINWTTSELANSTLSFGTTTALGSSTSSSSNTTTQTLQATGRSASTLYYYNVTSCDLAGNCNTSGPYTVTTNATTSSSSDSSSSSSGGASTTTTTTATTTEPTPVVTVDSNKVGTLPEFDSHTEKRRVKLGEKATLTYTHVKEQHTVVIKLVNGTKVTITLASKPFDVTLATGEEKTYDVTSDNKDDIKIKLISITGKNVILEISPYASPAITSTPKTTSVTTGTNETNTNQTNTTTNAPSANGEFPIIPLVIVIIIVAVIGFWKMKSSEPKYPLARKPTKR